MQNRILSLVAPLVVGIMALALGWFAHAPVPLAAQGAVVQMASPSDPAAPAALVGARLTYQGRLTSSSGAPINAPVTITFRIYTSTPAIAIWTSAPRSITPTNGLFTVYLGDGADASLGDDALIQAASIGVTVGADAEMTPRQPLNSVVGHGDSGVGVFGSSNKDAGVLGISISNTAVFGRSSSLFGVYGFSDTSAGVAGFSSPGFGVRGGSDSGIGVVGTSSSGNAVVGVSTLGSGVDGTSAYSSGVRGFSTWADGVVGITAYPLHAGVAAQAAVTSSIALEIITGGIKATGAGIGTNTFAFIHKSAAANIASNVTRLDNALTNGDRDAMVFVTHVNNPTTIASNSFTVTLGVYYDSITSQWSIYREDGMPFPPDVTFNVMVVKR